MLIAASKLAKDLRNGHLDQVVHFGLVEFAREDAADGPQLLRIGFGAHNANHEGVFATSIESDELLDRAHQAAADFVGTDDPGTIAFGANMTTLTFALSRALATTWRQGDT